MLTEEEGVALAMVGAMTGVVATNLGGVAMGALPMIEDMEEEAVAVGAVTIGMTSS